MKNIPAFPYGDPWHGGKPGMSLRDYFAGQALAGIGTWTPSRDGEPPVNRVECQIWQAEWAYEMADAMLAARGESQ